MNKHKYAYLNVKVNICLDNPAKGKSDSSYVWSFGSFPLSSDRTGLLPMRSNKPPVPRGLSIQTKPSPAAAATISRVWLAPLMLQSGTADSIDGRPEVTATRFIVWQIL